MSSTLWTVALVVGGMTGAGVVGLNARRLGVRGRLLGAQGAVVSLWLFLDRNWRALAFWFVVGMLFVVPEFHGCHVRLGPTDGCLVRLGPASDGGAP